MQYFRHRCFNGEAHKPVGNTSTFAWPYTALNVVESLHCLLRRGKDHSTLSSTSETRNLKRSV